MNVDRIIERVKMKIIHHIIYRPKVTFRPDNLKIKPNKIKPRKIIETTETLFIVSELTISVLPLTIAEGKNNIIKNIRTILFILKTPFNLFFFKRA